jgi:hypothetical protein
MDHFTSKLGSTDRNPQERNSGMKQMMSLPGVVRALGSEALNPAKLYSELTGRPFTYCTTVNDLQITGYDVVLCATAHLSASLMHKLYVEGDSPAPGLICAPNEQKLAQVCQKHVLRLTQSPAPPKRIFLYPTLDFPAQESGIDIVLSGTSQDRILCDVSSGASVLSIVGHSDGIDLSLSARQFACPFFDDFSASNDELSVPCQVLGKCVKFPAQPSIAEAREMGLLAPLAKLRADVAIIFGCYVLKVRDGTINPAYGLAPALLQKADFGALITTWRKEFYGGWPHLGTLVNQICAGTMVGLAVRDFNRSAVAQQYGVNLCVMGDPCYVLAPNSQFTRLPEPAADPVAKQGIVPSGGLSEHSEIMLLKDAAAAAPQISRLFDRDKAGVLIAALSSYANNGNSQKHAIGKIESAHLDLLRASPWLDKYFAHLCSFRETSEKETCPHCMAPARALWMNFPKHGARPRRILRCAACDDVSNLPEGWNASIDLADIDQNRVLLTGLPEGSQLQVSLTSFWGSLYDSFTPPAPNSCQALISLPDNLPAMPIYGWVLIARGLEIGAVSFRIRKHLSGNYSSPHSVRIQLPPVLQP